MKLFISGFFSFVLIFNLAKSQDSVPTPPCEQVDISKDKEMIIKNFIKDCEKHGSFVNNKGILILKEFTNADGLLTWQLSHSIDDGYRDNPPTKFSDFEGDIVLIYEANSVGRKNQNPNPEAYNKCLEQIIGDRVYLNPTIKTRWTNRLMRADHKPMKRGMSRHVLDGGAEWIIVFNRDGTYKISY